MEDNNIPKRECIENFAKIKYKLESMEKDSNNIISNIKDIFVKIDKFDERIDDIEKNSLEQNNKKLLETKRILLRIIMTIIISSIGVIGFIGKEIIRNFIGNIF